MRKRLAIPESPSISDQAGLNLETTATLELTSEDERHPIRSRAFVGRSPRVACFGPWTADHPSCLRSAAAAQADKSGVQ